MDAQQVIDKILADAKNEADKIKKEAGQSQASEQAGFDKELAAYNKQSEVLAKKAGEDKKAHLLASARMDIAKDYLAEKRKILDEIFGQAQLQLQNLPDDEYRDLMAKLMLDAVETGDEEVIVDPNEKRIDEKFIEQINGKLSGGTKGNLKLSNEKQDIGAGFILKRGKIKNNVSAAVLFGQARKELEIELAKELFEDKS